MQYGLYRYAYSLWASGKARASKGAIARADSTEGKTIMGKRKFRITRYKIQVDKLGKAKLKASKKGYICRERDVTYLEEMLENKHASERISRDRADKERKATDSVKAQLVVTASELANIQSIMADAMELIRAHQSGDGVLIDRIESAVNAKGYWARLCGALTGN
jgi:hypothetical protein